MASAWLRQHGHTDAVHDLRALVLQDRMPLLALLVAEPLPMPSSPIHIPAPSRRTSASSARFAWGASPSLRR